MKKLNLTFTIISISFIAQASIPSSLRNISPKQIVLVQNKPLKDRFLEEQSANHHAYVPLCVKTTIRTCLEKYPELNQVIDLSLLLNDTHRVAPQESIAEITRKFLIILKESNLTNIDPSDNTVVVMERYLNELESGVMLIDLEKDFASFEEYEKRSINLFQGNTGLALSAGGILNLYGSTNFSTQASGQTVAIALGPNVTVTGAFSITGLGQGVVTSSATGLLSALQTTNNAVQVGNATGTLTSLPLGRNGQVLLGSSGAAPFFTGLGSPTNASGAVSMIYSSGSSFLALRSIPLLANVIRVDWLNGNDSTATVINGLPYKTISAALTAAGAAASSVSPYVIWVMPGIYTEALTLQQYVSVIGMSENTNTASSAQGGGVTIQQLNVSPATNATFSMITMAENSRLENVSLYLTSAAANSNITINGILFSGTQSATATVNKITLYMTYSGSNNSISGFNGISVTAAGSPNPEIFAFTNSTITVDTTLGTASVPTNGIIVTALSGGFNINLCTIGAQNEVASNIANGVITANRGTININNSVLSGVNITSAAFGNDINSAGFLETIYLYNTQLVHGTTNGFGFTASPSSYLSWGIQPGTNLGAIGTSVNKFMLPGTSTVANLTNQTTQVGTALLATRPLSIRNLRVNAATGPGGTTTNTFTLYKNNSSTSLTVTLGGYLNPSGISRNSVSFTGGDAINMVASTSSPTGVAQGVTATVEVY